MRGIIQCSGIAYRLNALYKSFAATAVDDNDAAAVESATKAISVTTAPATVVTIPKALATPSNRNDNERTPLLRNANSSKTQQLRYDGSGAGDNISYNNNTNNRTASNNNNEGGDGRDVQLDSGEFNVRPQRRARRLCDLWLIAFGVMLTAGLAIAVYLLIIETRVPRLEFSLDLMTYELWSRHALERGEPLTQSANVTSVLVTHTGGAACDQPSSCMSALHGLQRRHMNMSSSSRNSSHDGTAGAMALPYNFVIGSDGITYEVRGWDFMCDGGLLPLPLARNATLLVALMGNYTERAPSDEQLRSLHSLLQESVRRRKLHGGYQVYSVHNLTSSSSDAVELGRALQRLPQYARALHTH